MSINFTEQFRIRSATFDDTAAAAELCNTAAMHVTGEPTTSPERVKATWERPGFNIATDTWLVHTSEGKLVGYAGFSDRAPHVALWAWAYVHPDYRNQGIGAELIQLSDERAREVIPLAPENSRIALYRGVNTLDDSARRLFVQQGYASVRGELRMRIDLNDQLPAPVFPNGVRMRAIDSERDAWTVYRTVEDCFQDHWGFVKQPEDEGFAQMKHFMDTDPDFDYGEKTLKL